MKRSLIALFIAAVAAAPFAQADDIPDGKQCNEGTAAPAASGAADGEADRGAVCIHVEGTTILYVGGEAQADEEENRGTGGACGAIIILGEEITGDPDWDNGGEDEVEGDDPNTPDVDESADDEHCD